jgi:hypothetical protein
MSLNAGDVVRSCLYVRFWTKISTAAAISSAVMNDGPYNAIRLGGTMCESVTAAGQSLEEGIVLFLARR